MKFDNEVLIYVGSAAAPCSYESFAVVVYQPHGDRELTTIALDTPDGRRHDLDPAGARALAEALLAAPAHLEQQLRELNRDDEDDE